jgi:uncharacterized protein
VRFGLRFPGPPLAAAVAPEAEVAPELASADPKPQVVSLDAFRRKRD